MPLTRKSNKVSLSLDEPPTIAATLAVLTTTQNEHERRITLLEAFNYKLLLWAVGATCSSIVTLAAVVIDTVTRMTLK